MYHYHTISPLTMYRLANIVAGIKEYFIQYKQKYADPAILGKEIHSST